MTDSRSCIRGCIIKDQHEAACPAYGIKNDPRCNCRIPRDAFPGSLICSGCFGRLRRLLDDAPDLLGRLQALADPAKATPLDATRGPSALEPSGPVSADLLDAINALQAVLAAYDDWAVLEEQPGDAVRNISNSADAMDWFGPRVLDRHPDIDGIRSAWSVQDAVDRWGVERRDRDTEWADDDESSEEVEPVPEWGRPLVSKADAIRDYAKTERTLQRWLKAGWIQPATEGGVVIAGQRVTLFREADLVKCRDDARERKGGRPRGET